MHHNEMLLFSTLYTYRSILYRFLSEIEHEGLEENLISTLI